MDINDLRGLVVLGMLLTFLGLFAWAWSKHNRQRFEDAANLPFADEPGAGSPDHRIPEEQRP